HAAVSFLLALLRPPPTPPLFPYTTLFRSHFVVTPVRRLPKGPYTVRWHVLSSDGHVVSGVFTFGVRYPAPPPTEAFGASGPTSTDRKSTRLNSSHQIISYAVFCLKKKKTN